MGSNQRFVVTNLVRNPQFVYDDIYVLRGDVENRIEELKLELKADRLSCYRFLANQFRLLLHTAAYGLFWLLRHHLCMVPFCMTIHTACPAFPVIQAGRRSPHHFRGLLRVHSRYGPQDCSIAPGDLCRKTSICSVTRTHCSSATRLIAFAEKSFLKRREWASRESFQGAGCFIAIWPIHDP